MELQTPIDNRYKTHYKNSLYYPVWQNVFKYLRQFPDPKILEIGCGTGQLAHYLYDEGYKLYIGFDINKEAIKVANSLSPQLCFVGDVMDKELYVAGYDVVIATEVLEHIEDDIGVIKSLKKGVRFIFSVPRFGCEGHLRYFINPVGVMDHYFDCLCIKEIVCLKKFKYWFIGWGIVK